MKTHYLIHLIIIATGFLVGITFIKKTDKTIRPIIIYLGMVFICELINFFMAKIYRNNMPGHHVSAPIYLLCVGIFFYNNIENIKIKKTIPWVIGAFILFAIINALFFQPVTTNPDNCSQVAVFINIAWAAILYMQYLEFPADENVFKQPVFIVTIAILWFNIISFSNFLLYDFMRVYKMPMKTLFTIHLYSNYIYYLLLSTAIIVSKLQLKHARKIL